MTNAKWLWPVALGAIGLAAGAMFYFSSGGTLEKPVLLSSAADAGPSPAIRPGPQAIPLSPEAQARIVPHACFNRPCAGDKAGRVRCCASPNDKKVFTCCNFRDRCTAAGQCEPAFAIDPARFCTDPARPFPCPAERPNTCCPASEICRGDINACMAIGDYCSGPDGNPTTCGVGKKCCGGVCVPAGENCCLGGLPPSCRAQEKCCRGGCISSDKDCV